MRREVETILANTIYRKVTIKADSRLLSAFAGTGIAYAGNLEKGIGIFIVSIIYLIYEKENCLG